MSEYVIRTTNMPEHIREAVSAWYEIDSEIVRCRDCKKLNIVSECPCGFWALEDLNGFCKWGERRDA